MYEHSKRCQGKEKYCIVGTGQTFSAFAICVPETPLDLMKAIIYLSQSCLVQTMVHSVNRDCSTKSGLSSSS